MSADLSPHQGKRRKLIRFHLSAIAARLEFDIDPRRARWFSAWTQHATATPTPANIFNSTAPSGESSSSSNNQNHSRDPSAPTLVESTMHSRSSSTETEDSGHDAFDPSPLHPFNTRTYPNFRALVSPTLSTTPLARPGYPRRTLSLLANRTSVIQHAASHQPRSPREVQFTSRGQQSTPRQRDMSIDLTNFRLNDSGFVSSSPVLPIHSWPSTPASPDRLPSPDIAERTFIHTPTSTPLPPPPPRQRALVPPTVQTSETSAQQPRKLIERDWNVSVKPLWAISGTPTPTPTRVVFEQSAVTNEAVRSASNSFKSFVDYPTLHIYPSAYPHFSLYPPIHLEPVVELPLFASALRSPPESPVAYPFHLSLIYPSAYPNLHSQLYPSLVPQMPVVNVRRPSTRPPRITLTTSSYPQLTIYPSLSAVDSSYSPQFPPASVDVMPPPLDLNDFDELWPATPPSPDRLPSASLEERLMDSSYGWEEGRFLREQQKPSSVVVEETRAVKKLVERDWEAKVRPLKDVSEPSPAMAERTFEESEEAVTRGVVLDTESEVSISDWSLVVLISDSLEPHPAESLPSSRVQLAIPTATFLSYIYIRLHFHHLIVSSAGRVTLLSDIERRRAQRSHPIVFDSRGIPGRRCRVRAFSWTRKSTRSAERGGTAFPTGRRRRCGRG